MAKMTSTVTVTEENYCLAETQVIFAEYRRKISEGTGDTNGMGVFLHKRQAMDRKDKTVMRANYDTMYSFALLDLRASEATLVMPEQGGRYQTAWIVTEEHYNPTCYTTAGEHELTETSMGSQYVMVIMRTQVNMADTKDVAQAAALQDLLQIRQVDKGPAYVSSNKWDVAEVKKMRSFYQGVFEEKGFRSGSMFGKKGEVPLINHNCGAAYGWGGFTDDQAVYIAYNDGKMEPCSLLLTDVPVAAFWSVTVYDKDGNVPDSAHCYNINSACAEKSEDGSVIVNFGVVGGDNAGKANFMDIAEGWTMTLRLYLPTQAYFSGEWKKPELRGAN